MSSDLDKIRDLPGKKVVKVNIEWSNTLDDYYIDSIEFDDGSTLELWGDRSYAVWTFEEWQGGNYVRI